jgi:hypothetical protein
MDSAAFAEDTLFVYSTAIARRPIQIDLGINAELDGMTLTAGSYRVSVGLSLASLGIVILKGDASSKFLFQTGDTLNIGANAVVVLEGGVKAENVLWSLGSSATLGAKSEVSSD